MKKYLLDTGIVIRIGINEKVTQKLALLVSHDSIFKIIQGLWNELQFEDWME